MQIRHVQHPLVQLLHRHLERRPCGSIVMNRLLLLAVCCLAPLQVLANTETLSAIAESSSKFSRDFWKAVASTPGNLVTSPLSAQVGLGLLRVGARGSTADSLTSALRLPRDQQLANNGFRDLIDTLNNESGDGLKLEMVNRLFASQTGGFSLEPTFSSSARDLFRSDLQSVDFNDAATPALINDWVAGATHGKIKDLFAEDAFSDGQTRLVLVNAMYFNGRWLRTFDPRDTYNWTFHTGQDTGVQTPFMNLEDFYIGTSPALQRLNATLIELPYQGERTSMVILLPGSNSGLEQLERDMQTQDLSALTRVEKNVLAELFLPKFKIETTLQLEESLEKMGLSNIFSNQADFRGISTRPPLKVSSVVQKTFIQVGEEGTEAAVATGYKAVFLMERYPRPVRVSVDHPFLFYILHRTSDNHSVVLFSGRVTEPHSF